MEQDRHANHECREAVVTHTHLFVTACVCVCVCMRALTRMRNYHPGSSTQTKCSQCIKIVAKNVDLVHTYSVFMDR